MGLRDDPKQRIEAEARNAITTRERTRAYRREMEAA